MRILSIETSCDETGVAILQCQEGTSDIALLGNTLSSQIELHAKYGGVFPALAKRAHAEKIVPLIIESLNQAGLLAARAKVLSEDLRSAVLEMASREGNGTSYIDFFETYQKPDIDYIAVTVGPGLEPALWVGVNAAKILSLVWQIPVIAINHMEGHIVTAAFEKSTDKKYRLLPLQFPVLALLVSGGHTELVVVPNFGAYQKIGQTRDDAVGEAFDKVARMLGLPYPGGPAVSRLAAQYRSLKARPVAINLPRPMIHSGNYDFSFSGIKTAVLYAIRDMTDSNSRQLTDEEKMAIACAFEDAVVEVLIVKTIAAAEEYQTPTIIVGGGVAGNTYLHTQLETIASQDLTAVTLLFPEPWLATDNAVMIGMAALSQILAGNIHTEDPRTLKANGNLSIDTL